MKVRGLQFYYLVVSSSGIAPHYGRAVGKERSEGRKKKDIMKIVEFP